MVCLLYGGLLLIQGRGLKNGYANQKNTFMFQNLCISTRGLKKQSALSARIKGKIKISARPLPHTMEYYLQLAIIPSWVSVTQRSVESIKSVLYVCRP